MTALSSPLPPPVLTGLKLGWTAWLCVLIPAYLAHHEPANFLWFSDIGLIGGCIALWAGLPLLASVMALGAAGLDLLWIGDGAIHLLTGASPLGMTTYMTDPAIPLTSRLLSLFHIPLPVALLMLLKHLGYDRRAFGVQCALLPVILILSHTLGSPEANINRVYGLGPQPQTFMPPALWIFLESLFLLAAVSLPSHLIFKRCFGVPLSAASPEAERSDQPD